MFTHKQIWAGIDAVAEAKGLSVSALAKKAGLDASALNLSKRVSHDGHMRWPSTETLSRVLMAADMDLNAFADIVAMRSEKRTLALSRLPNIPDHPVR